jgi:hypothetical protein
LDGVNKGRRVVVNFILWIASSMGVTYGEPEVGSRGVLTIQGDNLESQFLFGKYGDVCFFIFGATVVADTGIAAINVELKARFNHFEAVWWRIFGDAYPHIFSEGIGILERGNAKLHDRGNEALIALRACFAKRDTPL